MENDAPHPIWRVGRKNPHNVYRQLGEAPRGMGEDGADESLGYFRDPADARTAAACVTALHAIYARPELLADVLELMREHESGSGSLAHTEHQAFVAGWQAARDTGTDPDPEFDTADASDAWACWSRERVA